MPAVATALTQQSNCSNDDGEIAARYCAAACTTPSVAPASSSPSSPSSSYPSSGAQRRPLKLSYDPLDVELNQRYVGDGAAPMATDCSMAICIPLMVLARPAQVSQGRRRRWPLCVLSRPIT